MWRRRQSQRPRVIDRQEHHTTATRPPVAQPALDGLLLTADEVNAAMGISGMTLLPQNGTAMQDDYDKKWPPECFFASSSAEDPGLCGQRIHRRSCAVRRDDVGTE